MQVLWLTGTKVSDAGLAHLAGMKKLETLDLQGTAVTPAALARLKKQLRASGLDAFLTTNITNVAYLTGFSGSSGYLLVTKSEGGRHPELEEIRTRVADDARRAKARERLEAAIGDIVADYDVRLDYEPDAPRQASTSGGAKP